MQLGLAAQPPSMREKAGTPGLPTPYPYTWLQWCQAIGRVVGALFAAFPDKLDDPPNRSCSDHSLQGERR